MACLPQVALNDLAFVAFELEGPTISMQWRISVLSLIFVIFILLFSAIFRIVEGLNSNEALYLSIVTITTLGYGDVEISSNMGRFFAGIEAILGLVFFGASISWIIQAKFYERQKEFEKRFRNQIAEKNWRRLQSFCSILKDELSDLSLLQSACFSHEYEFKINQRFTSISGPRGIMNCERPAIFYGERIDEPRYKAFFRKYERVCDISWKIIGSVDLAMTPILEEKMHRLIILSKYRHERRLDHFFDLYRNDKSFREKYDDISKYQTWNHPDLLDHKNYMHCMTNFSGFMSEVGDLIEDLKDETERIILSSHPSSAR